MYFTANKYAEEKYCSVQEITIWRMVRIFYDKEAESFAEILLKWRKQMFLLNRGKEKQQKRRLMPLESVGVLITNIKMTFLVIENSGKIPL